MRGLVSLLAALILVGLVPPGRVAGEQEPLAVYRGTAGPAIISFASGWTGPERLAAVLAELLRNEHGTEMALLAAVELRPGDATSYYVGRFRGWDDRYRLTEGRIILYVGRETRVAGIARTLSHEYGHHFTYYWLADAEGVMPRDAPRTRWARLRGVAGDERLVFGGPDHAWDPAEIMAEDYVQLFGSPLAKALYRPHQRGPWPGHALNVRPQENREIPLAHEVPGLEAFWRSRAGLPPARGAPPERPALRLAATEPVGSGAVVELAWAPVAGEGPITYTLLADRPGQPVPIPLAVTAETAATAEVAPRPDLSLYLLAVDGAGRVVSSAPVQPWAEGLSPVTPDR